MAGWIKMPLNRKVGLNPSNIVLDGAQLPLPQKGGRAPQFSAYVYWCQTAGWMEMPFGTEVDLSPGHFVLDRDSAPPARKRGTAAPTYFRPMSIVGLVATVLISTTAELLLEEVLISMLL